MNELVEYMAQSLVDDPGSVTTRTLERDHATVIELNVAPADLGKVIGRQGRTARAMRTVLGAAGQRQRRRYILDIVD